jgi:FdhE protein
MTSLNAAAVVSRSPEAATRATRARVLADRYPQASEPLAYYAALVDSQQAILASNPIVRGIGRFSDAIDFERAADALPFFLKAITPGAPAALASVAREMLHEGHDEWRHLLHTYWNGGRDGDPRRAFVAEAMLQPFAEAVARRVASSADASDVSMTCPVCGDQPVAAVLRDQAHGARRSFVCGFCLTEWPAPRLGCPACGEVQFEKLPVYRADEFTGVRVDCCDTCRMYLKTIDLTKDATAVPVVDDIATLTLDAWAREQGYTRLRPHLLRL